MWADDDIEELEDALSDLEDRLSLVADGLAEIRRGHFDHGATLIEAALSSRTPDPHLERKKYAEAMAAKEASHA
jgi:hypothetical protein